MRRRGGPVQQWVDSIPSYGNAASTFTPKLGESSQNRSDLEGKNSTRDNNNAFLKEKLLRKTEDMTASAPITVPNSPAITMTCPASSVPHNRLVRDPSLQSDSSHCSSVESLLEWRKADPEAILLGLGFGYPSSPQENGSMARIPRRFLQPSKLKGIAVDEFLKQQQESNESLDSASLGYRGLTGSPYVAASEIVQKIMERLKEHESHEIDSFTNSSSDLFGSMQQDGRLSVLSPDNRQYLERPRSKSPDMRNKRMIIGEKSFAFGYNGDLIEVESLNREDSNFIENSTDYRYNSNIPTTNLQPEVIAPAQTSKSEENDNSKAGKLSGRRLAKQLSFDEDSSSYDSRDTLYTMDRDENQTLVDQRITEEQRESLINVFSRWSEGNEATIEKYESIPRRASDSLYDSNLKRNSVITVEERRMSDGGIQSKIQRLSKGDRKNNDKKPGLKRQARVSDADAIDFENVSPSTPGLDKMDDYVSEDKTLSEDDIKNDSRTFKALDREATEDKDNGNTTSGSNEGKDDQKPKRFGNDELGQICEHEETSMECSCSAGSSDCRTHLSKMMQENRKLEDMVARTTQEMAELREMLNNVMSVKTEPRF